MSPPPVLAIGELVCWYSSLKSLKETTSVSTLSSREVREAYSVRRHLM